VYEIQILEPAADELAKLDAVVARRVIARLRRLASAFDDIRPQPLTGPLSGFYKLRVGDYRVIYEVLRLERVLIVHMIRHRREVYR
jgi:mRNA interferase RelE/StbE